MIYARQERKAKNTSNKQHAFVVPTQHPVRQAAVVDLAVCEGQLQVPVIKLTTVITCIPTALPVLCLLFPACVTRVCFYFCIYLLKHDYAPYVCIL